MIEIRTNPLRYAPWTLYVVLEHGREILRQLSKPSPLDIEYGRRETRAREAAQAAAPKPKHRPAVQPTAVKPRFQRAPAPPQRNYVDDSML